MTSRLTLAILLVAGLGIPATARAEPAASNNDAWMIQDSAQNSMEYAKTNQTTVWQNPDTGSTGDITPVLTYQNDQGEYCREYQQTVTIGGEQQQVYGTACRMSDGTWEIVSSEALDDPQEQLGEQIVPSHRELHRNRFGGGFVVFRGPAGSRAGAPVDASSRHPEIAVGDEAIEMMSSDVGVDVEQLRDPGCGHRLR